MKIVSTRNILRNNFDSVLARANTAANGIVTDRQKFRHGVTQPVPQTVIPSAPRSGRSKVEMRTRNFRTI